MKRIILATIGLLLFALAAFLPAAPAPLVRRERNTNERIACILEADPTCVPCEAPNCQVRLVNQTRRAILLVGSLDGSWEKARYPLCYFEVAGPGGEWELSRCVGDCVFKNMLREKDFVWVAGGASFDPFMHVDDGGFFGGGLDRFQFERPGKHRLRFVYSTQSTDFSLWAGVGPGHKPQERAGLERLLVQVPKLTLVSNEVIVEVLPRK